MDLEPLPLPFSSPLKTLQELADGSYLFSPTFPFNRSSVPLLCSHKPQRPRLLVCHDFKGGYQDDKWPQGNANGGAYSLWHWDLVDVFVYFSHNLVTLPPPGWINAAHKHGVQVLGTFITEWSEGAALCRTLLQSSQSVEMYASRLTELAYESGFDGWLVNIENPVSKNQIPLLLEFLQLLTGMMHSIIPGSLVIWYDAVTIEGTLIWQNCLNRYNEPFFDVCDGIFTNYSWTLDSPIRSAKIAGERAFDVYMGVDVFGRNTFGGGGFQSDIALQVARTSGVSAALFAPGWVYETDQGPDFHTAQDRWWGSIKASWPRARKNPVKLPFFSDFDQGIGNAVYVKGRQVHGSPWSNLSCQNLQVLFDAPLSDPKGSIQTFVSQKEKAYSGGSCMDISGVVSARDLIIVNLHHSSLEISEGPLHVSYSVVLKPNCELYMALEVENGDCGRLTYFLIESDLQSLSLEDNADFFVKMPTNKRVVEQGVWAVREYVLQMDACIITHMYALILGGRSHYKALREEYACALKGGSITDDGSACPDTPYGGLLGHIRIANWDQAACRLFTAACDFQGQHIVWTGDQAISIQLTWEVLAKDRSMPASCEPDHSKIFTWEDDSQAQVHQSSARFLGVAKVNLFNVYKLPISKNCKEVCFALQRFCSCGGVEDLSEAHRIRLPACNESETAE